MNRYLFLDIDGVLNSERTVAATGRLVHAGRIKHDMLLGKFDPLWDVIAVNLLRTAQEALGFKIVISSSWRHMFSIQEFHAIFDRYDWDTRGIIVGKTGPNVGIRGQQIESWLGSHGTYPYSYCIIDDDSDMMPKQHEYFVKTSYQNGLDYQSFVGIYEAFGEEYDPVGHIKIGRK